MRGGYVIGLFVLLAMALRPSGAAAIPVTIDDFEDDTTMGWFVPDPGHPAPPSNISTGGPAGAGDNYLELTATGTPGPGGRLSVLNDGWAGDYIAAGLTAIAMDVRNFGPADVTLRLLFEDFAGPGPPVNLVTTLTDVVVPAGSGWVHVVFDLSASNLTALIGTVPGALSSVDVLRIFHNPDADFPGPPFGPPRVNTVVGVDNIEAVPEPTAVVLLVGGLSAALVRRRNRKTWR
jgi:hypothetical protein